MATSGGPAGGGIGVLVYAQRKYATTNMTWTGSQFNQWIELAAQTGGPGTGGLDLVIAAKAGDVIQLWPSMMSSGSSSANHWLYFDASAVASGNRVSGGAAGGVSGWGYLSFSTASATARGTPFCYTVVAGDVSGGNVTFRMLLNDVDGMGGIVYGNVTSPFWIFAVNLTASA